MGLEIIIEISGNIAKLSFCDIATGKILTKTKWEVKKDLSDKLFRKIDLLLKKSKISFSNIKKVSFDCDSPYFSRPCEKDEIKMEGFDSVGKCGFTAWQTGEVISAVMNFAIRKEM